MHNDLMYFPLSSQIRNVYLRTLRNQYWKENIFFPRQFYSMFIKKGSLVFDIGANVGEHSRCFLSLGAHVVAVEPLPANADLLRNTLRPKNRFQIIQAAAGADFSESTLHVSNHTNLCTLSDHWLDTAKTSERFCGVSWTTDIRVPVIPIHSLVSKYGQPDFIKIDVEGFEEQVLDGLKELPAALSFEFNTESLDAATACLAKPCFSDESKFAFYIGEPKKEGLSRWMSRNEIASEIRKISYGQQTYGDILALRQ
jgi:FkbM family methyltransferase